MSDKPNTITIDDVEYVRKDSALGDFEYLDDIDDVDEIVGKYVVVRCRDAGVHAGFLVGTDGRSCDLARSRRLWYWKCAKGAFLSGVAVHGLNHDESKIGVEQPFIRLTENCEIALCTSKAAKSIMGAPNHNE